MRFTFHLIQKQLINCISVALLLFLNQQGDAHIQASPELSLSLPFIPDGPTHFDEREGEGTDSQNKPIIDPLLKFSNWSM